MKLSVVVPVFNEERTIAQALDAVRRVDLTAVDPSHTMEIIVVDDGSTDGTRTILATYADLPEVHVVLHDQNRGKAQRCEQGSSSSPGISSSFRTPI
jgi:glycosyltransferase involved in cell wall biosynthesis